MRIDAAPGLAMKHRLYGVLKYIYTSPTVALETRMILQCLAAERKNKEFMNHRPLAG